jgi:hypothetical protein
MSGRQRAGKLPRARNPRQFRTAETCRHAWSIIAHAQGEVAALSAIVQLNLPTSGRQRLSGRFTGKWIPEVRAATVGW